MTIIRSAFLPLSVMTMLIMALLQAPPPSSLATDIATLVSDTPPVAPLPQLQKLENGVELSWAHASHHTEYEVWRSDQPDFTPGDMHSARLAVITATTGLDAPGSLRYIDIGAPTGADSPFYMVRSKNSAGALANSPVVTLRPSPPPVLDHTPPPRPMLIFGRVKDQGVFVADDTQVQACTPGYGCVSTTTYHTSNAKRGFYVLTIPGDMPGTAAVEGATPGDPITFTLRTAIVQPGQTVVWEEGALLPLNLFSQQGRANAPTDCVALEPVVTIEDMSGTISKTFEVPANAQDIWFELVGAGYRAGNPPQPPVHVTFTYEDGKTTTLSYPSRHIYSAPLVAPPGNMAYVFETRGRTGQVNVSLNDPDNTAYALLVHYNLPVETSSLVQSEYTLRFVWGGDYGQGAQGPAESWLSLPQPLAVATDVRVSVSFIGKEPQVGRDQRIAIVRAEAGATVVERIITSPDVARTNLVELTLPDVPPGTDNVRVSLISPATPAGQSQWNNPNAGDSVFLLESTISVPCSGFASTRQNQPQTATSQSSPVPSATATPGQVSRVDNTATASATRTASPARTASPTASATRTASPTASATVQTAATADPRSTLITPDEGGVLEVDGIRIIFPAGAVSETVRLVYTPLATPSAVLWDGRSILKGFKLEAFTTGPQPRAVRQFARNLTIEASYTAAQLAAAGVAESGLVLAYFDEGAGVWVTIDTSHVNTQENLIYATLDHFTEFAIATTYKRYMPFVGR